MARADLLVSLVRSGAVGDQRGFHRAAEALIAEERAKRHAIVARELTEALYAAPNGSDRPPSPAAQAPDGLVFEVEPNRALSEMVLPGWVRSACNDLVEEQSRRSLLRSHGLEPRHRVLVVGPPGCGKTTLAEALASALMLPLLIVRYEGLIGSYLGETASRMRVLFDAARVRPCLLFFDEFDAVAKERGDVHETGEIKRVVSSLLMQIDRLPSHVVVVAATNHQELLDRAVWRRMQLRLSLPPATRSSRTEWLEAWVARTGSTLGLAPRTIADELGGASFAELEEFALDLQRRVVLDGADANPRAIARRTLDQWSRRASA